MTTGFDPSAALDGECRRTFLRALSALAEAPAGGLEGALSRIARDDTVWRVAHPIDVVEGRAEGLARVWMPLKAALPDLERRDGIFVSGGYEGRTYVAAMGHYCGTMRRDWLGIPATGKPVYLRYGEVWQLDGEGRAVQATLLWDVLDLMRQAGVWPLAPPLGSPEAWPAPITADGVRLAPSDPDISRASLAQTLAMHRSLAEHDDRASLSRGSLIAMPQRDYWHPKMMWYGPAGIGTTRGLDGFVDGHQLPFRIAFQRPQGTFEEVTAERARNGAGHYIRIGDGPYSVTGGWPSVYAIHGGGGFCGLPPTGKPVFMRVMDFYLHHEGLIRENWVPLDMLDLLRQMGVEPLARMREVLRRGAP
ncbi:ester cyclase [Salinarimonas sp. NSM]|uniref:ester cyclase n=1 Tax=Salinarimonas sp. NSM TaxID=3458003 RepID=UPI0040354C79